MKLAVHIFILGRVQGVFFRLSMKRRANKMEVSGWVRNLSDGRVEAFLEGEKENVEQLIEWMKKGPILARVDDLDIEWKDYKGEFNNFSIRY